MTLVLKNVARGYNYIFHENQDPAIKDYLLLGSPISVIIIAAVYINVVQSWGPKLMVHRKPFDLARLMMLYNVFQVIANLYITIEIFNASVMNPEFRVICEPISHGNSPSHRRFVAVSYVYFVIKLTDLLDTIFFVLRKKNNQVTFLHVYHHAGMVIIAYGYTKFIAGSHGVFVGLINAFVHVIMYGYYFMTLFKPELKTSLWWKKYITQLQMIQFAILTVYFTIPLFVKSCNYPLFLLFIGIIQSVFMFALFFDFYVKAYLRKKLKPNN